MKGEKYSILMFYIFFVVSLMLIVVLSILSIKDVYAGDAIQSGKKIYETSCIGCHESGVLGAPKLRNQDDWRKREKQGLKTLKKHAISGFNNMPAKGGNPTIKDKEIENAIAYMLFNSGFKAYASKAKANLVVEKGKNKKATKITKSAGKTVAKSNINRFNRLMKSSSEWNLPPLKDGIHDSENDGTGLLQPPKNAFDQLTRSNSGNRVDWVRSLQNSQITPRYDRLDDSVKPVVMDLNIVREVKGSMPDVVYPHKQHTEWLDCSNCHPAIFIPQKGANQISMASILLGQQCGVCHGKVAFPVSECRKCHSKNKSPKEKNRKKN